MINVDLFTVECLKCGHSFGLSDQELYEMRSCHCPNCGQEMNRWTFFDLKRAYFCAIDMLGKILSLGPFAPEPPNFRFTISGDPSESEDVRLIKFNIALNDKMIAKLQSRIDSEKHDEKEHKKL